MSRDAAMAGFLAAQGFGGARLDGLAQDASFRRYWRLRHGDRGAVLMDAPPEREDTRPFLALQTHLAGGGLSVPAVLGADPGQGFVLLEDFGDGLFGAVLEQAGLTPLYDAATDALAVLHGLTPPDWVPRWGAAEMAAAAGATFLEWWWPAAFGAPPQPEVRTAFAAAMAAMLGPLELEPAVLVHRDYFAGNLFWLDERDGVRRVGIIDFQDAALGPAAYDLVALVEDARRDLPAALGARERARYLAARPGLDGERFAASYAICAAQRHLRVAALWVRLARRDGKPGYLAHGARCWRLLGQALRHPATTPLAGFLDRYVPPARRGNP